MKPILLLALAACGIAYSQQQQAMDSTVRIEDPSREMVVVVEPSVGNIATSFQVGGKEILFVPENWSKTSLAGNPLLAPWANRLDQDAFYANGNKYLLNPELKNFGRDGNGHPIHGLLAFSPYWEVVSKKQDEVTSRLEFWRYPDLMAQFPFAHTIEMTYALHEGALEVRTHIENLSKSPMPVSVGYHPYFQIPDSQRDDWRVHVAAREHVELTKELIPDGKRTPVKLPDPAPLAGVQLDDVFADLVRDANGRAEFWVEGGSRKIVVAYGPKYTVGVVWAPPGRNFLCIEPMSGITNAFNLAHAGTYKELQSIPPGGVWEESYWIRPEGF